METGLTWFWSRSRQKFWQKGETSGHIQRIKEILYDCDQDTLLIKVEQTGPACHTGSRTCFFRGFNQEGNHEPRSRTAFSARSSKKRYPAKIVYEDDLATAFEDVNPQAPVHILIVPKKHIPEIHSMTADDKDIVGHLFLTAQKIADEKGLHEKGYRMVINNGAGVGQTVFHIHLHILSGRKFSWPPG